VTPLEEIEIEDRKRQMFDADKKRDAERNMSYAALAGMLAFPLLIIISSFLGLDKAAQFGLSLANRGIGSMNNPFGGKTQAQIDATPVYDMGRQPVGPPTNMGIMDTYKGAELPTISMQSLPQLYADDFYE